MSVSVGGGSEVRVAFARVDEAAKLCLQALWPVVEPRLDGILNSFYSHVVQHPEMAALVGDRQASLESAQKKHWKRLFSGAFDDEYVQSIDRIGRAHSRIGLEPRWYIAGYQYVLNELIAVVMNKYRFSPKKAIQAVQVLNKAVMLDLDFAISTYQQILMEAQEAQTRHLSDAVDRFKDTVETSLRMVDQTADRMQEQAGTLSGVANSASQEAVSASAASEETSVSVQTVASARKSYHPRSRRSAARSPGRRTSRGGRVP